MTTAKKKKVKTVKNKIFRNALNVISKTRFSPSHWAYSTNYLLSDRILFSLLILKNEISIMGKPEEIIPTRE